MKNFFSIITVCYNDLSGLKSTHDSIWNQCHTDFEWIVIDGNSADGTAEWLSRNHQFHGHWISEEDRGIYDAMNKGLDLSTGKYIIFMNSGDRFHDSDTLCRIRDEISASPKYPDFVFGDSIDVFPGGHGLHRKARDIEFLVNGMVTQHQAMLFLRDFIDGWRFPEHFAYSGDYALACWTYTNSRSFLKLQFPVCKFQMGGRHHQHRLKAMKEDYSIRRTILGTSSAHAFLLHLLHFSHFLVKKFTPGISRFLRYRLQAFFFFFSFFMVLHDISPAYSAPRVVPLDHAYSHVLAPGDDATFLVGVEDATRYSSLTFRIFDLQGRLVREHSLPLNHVGPGRSFARLRQAIDTRDHQGWFAIRAYAEAPPQVDIESEIPFVVLPDDSRPSGFLGLSGLWGLAGSTSRLDDYTSVLLQKLGVPYVRFFVAWQLVQSPDELDPLWRQIDSLLLALDGTGIDLLPVLVISPDYAVRTPQTTSAKYPRARMPDLTAWKEFVAALAERYSDRIRAWEIWNEPNAAGFWAGSVKDYALLLESAYPIIKRTNSESIVLNGGTSGIAAGWLTRLTASTNSFDGFSIHSYRKANAPPETGMPEAGHYGGKPLASALAAVSRIAPQKPVWITETGLNTAASRPGIFKQVSLIDQAARMARHAILARASGVDRIYWWLLEDGFGLGTGIISREWKEFKTKPSLATMAFLNRIMTPETRITPKTGNRYYSFLINNPSGPYTVLWSLENVAVKLTPKSPYYFELDGNKVTIPQGKPLEIRLDTAPKFFPGDIEVSF